jgi:hypothetical protein
MTYLSKIVQLVHDVGWPSVNKATSTEVSNFHIHLQFDLQINP